MQSNNLNRNNILVAIGSIILIGAAVYYFFNRDTSSDDLLSVVPAGQVSGVDGDLLSTLRQLKSMKLDDSVFSDPVFVKLQDYSKPLVSQGRPGRSNPFAPLGSDLSSVSVASTTR